MENIKAIIFDLGGVLLNIDYTLTRAAFARLGVQEFDAHFSQFKASPIFEDLETGKIGNNAFYSQFREISNLPLTPNQIRDAWNAMLLDFPRQRMELLLDVKKRYRTFLLSNTNAIHYEAFHKTFRDTTGLASLDDCFEKAYYSHLIGERKPHAAAYEFVLRQNDLRPEETLFIDDTLPNIIGAQAVGIQTVHLTAPITVEQLGL